MTQRDAINRRGFLGAAALGLGAAALARGQDTRDRPEGGPVVIASGNGANGTTALAAKMIRDGADPLDAVIAGVALVEDDPDDMSVGLGGLPNEEGIVELDASVMHGPMHRAGSVAALRNVRNASAVAREVARRTDHVMLVGEGALKFARRMGFEEQDLLTEKARNAWLRWRARLNKDDDWLDREQFDLPGAGGAGGRGKLLDVQGPDAARRAAPLDFTWGTIHCSAVTPTGDLAGTTTTSGLSWKLPGRVGDSPIIGAGLYTDNDIGSAGATGRGEAAIQTCAAHTVVMRMGVGDHPKDACLHVLRLVARKTRSPRLLDERGRPNFQLTMYALRKDGVFGSACMKPGGTFAISDDRGDRREDAAILFE